MEIPLPLLRQWLLRATPAHAWQKTARYFGTLSQEERQRRALALAALVRDTFGDVDPVAQELFIGRMFMENGLPDAAKDAFRHAAAWEEARKRAQAESGLDFDDEDALYHFLGANDFREYVERNNPAKAEGAKLMLDGRTVGHLFHALQMEHALPLTTRFPGASWLTVGDGRHAFEARFLARHGAKALATNLDPTLLEEARSLGAISTYGVEDMERLSFADRSFDFVCCKDSLHHCRQPYRALYEMARVAREGLFLVEPFDHGFWESAIYKNRVSGFHHFEKGPGNYAYSLSERELEKLGVGLGWRALAVRGVCCLHDHPVPLDSVAPHDRRRQRDLVAQAEQEAAAGGRPYTSLCAILLRREPDSRLRQLLADAGFAIVDLPCNPHLKRDVLESLSTMYARR